MIRAAYLSALLSTAILASSSIAGCDGPESSLTLLETGPLGAYATEVQPHVAERCASGGCHGRADRRLRLYAPGHYRADASRLHLDEPLTQQELGENARRLAAFAHGSELESSELFCKPLALEAGGCAHGVGEVFVDWTDPTCLALERWLSGRAPVDGGLP
ncbi:MAG: hypothetical protein DRJ42_08755 [Deltaproteobacteria bacterium]|nr:MAG: hypothetical protein DRJ42_08755 [Deltaproteobacteria bacterium]